MAFRLKAADSPGRGVRRVVKAQIEKAMEAVAKPVHACGEKRVHDTRKCVKRIRAVLKLARPGLTRGTYQQENARFREIGRELSPVRDVTAILDAFHSLITRYGDQGQPHEFDAVHEAIELREQTVRESFLNEEEKRHHLGRALEEARADLGDWATDDLDWCHLEIGIKRILKASRDAYKTARESRVEADLHEWRKRLKDLAYGLELLDGRHDHSGHSMRDQVGELGKCLGSYRDFSMLRAVITASTDGAMTAAATVILPLIDVSRANSERSAFAIGEQLAQHRSRKISSALITIARQI